MQQVQIQDNSQEQTVSTAAVRETWVKPVVSVLSVAGGLDINDEGVGGPSTGS